MNEFEKVVGMSERGHQSAKGHIVRLEEIESGGLLPVQRGEDEEE
jgi:hypothetical protein